MTHVLRTDRLVLAPLGADDLAAWHALNMEPGVRRFLFDDQEWTLDETRERLLAENLRMWSEEGRGLHGIRTREGGALEGWIGWWYFHEPPVLELGYALHPRAWGLGYATEAARAVMADASRRFGEAVFRASTDAPNESSIRVLGRLGFREVRRSPGPVHETVHFVREPGPASPEAELPA